MRLPFALASLGRSPLCSLLALCRSRNSLGCLGLGRTTTSGCGRNTAEKLRERHVAQRGVFRDQLTQIGYRGGGVVGEQVAQGSQRSVVHGLLILGSDAHCSPICTIFYRLPSPKVVGRRDLPDLLAPNR